MKTPRLRGTRARLFGENGPRTVAQFLCAAVVLSVVAYFLKGRDRGLAFWQMLVGCAVFIGLGLLIQAIVERYGGD